MSAKKKLEIMETKRMRGYEGLTGWVLLMASAPGKKWEPGKVTGAFDSIRAFVAMSDVNKRLGKRAEKLPSGAGRNMREGLMPSPLRLLAPGGIIAAEHGVKPRKDKRTQRKSKTALKTTEQLISPMSTPRSSLLDHPGYPHQTTPAKPKD